MAERIEFKFEVKGFEGLVNRLQIFPDRIQQKAARRAARKGMNIVRDAARAKAKLLDDPDTKKRKIWKNIVTNESGRRGRAIGGIVMKVGVRGGALARPNPTPDAFSIGKATAAGVPAFQSRRKRRTRRLPSSTPHPGGDTRYWRHLEFGTRFMRARTFMLPALMNNAQAVGDKIAEVLNVEIDKLLAGKIT
jgi:HK97 gp10 family phage protein